MSKLKYLMVFILPITVFISYTNYGVWTFSPIIFAFIIVPIIELFFKPNKSNLNEEASKKAQSDFFYDLLLMLTLPIQLTAVFTFFYVIQDDALTSIGYIGRITALGAMCGVFGINVGHELGHRTESRLQQFFGELLLLTSLETHFLPYHNSGHHVHVATLEDPATARKNEPLYVFWFRSQFGSYKKAWQLEIQKLQITKKTFFSKYNRMLIYTLSQITVLFLIYFFFGKEVLFAFTAAAIFGILLLETVNYIEHYGLLRAKKANGRYEQVKPRHSWNSDHMMGRLLLFELSRHSDHHYRASKHYQILKSVPNSPQMITGYPGMMLLSLIPPIWFKIMNKQIEDFNKSLNL